MSNRKTYVLDTNVLMYDPRAIMQLRGNDVVIPMPVLEELDKHKKGREEKNKAARDVVKFIDAARASGSLKNGVFLEALDISLRVVMLDPDSASFKLLTSNGQDKDYNDNLILAICMDMSKKAAEKKKRKPILITKDISLRVKADSVGVATEDYKEGAARRQEVLEGNVEDILIDQDSIDYLHEDPTNYVEFDDLVRQPNALAMLESPSSKALARFISPTAIKLVSPPTVYGLNSRNREQAFAIDLIMDPDIHIVALAGPAGTGKSILALAAALELTVNQNKYERVCIGRVPVDMGKGIGFLPGSMDEKLAPWMQMLTDNFEALSAMGKKGKVNAKQAKEQMQSLQHFGKLELLSSSHIRGRSIPSSIIIFEEAQNASPHELKSIITRASKNTKVILTGDPDQIDVPYLDRYSNGLTYVIDRMSADEDAQKVFGHVILTKSERSKLAEIAGRVL